MLASRHGAASCADTHTYRKQDKTDVIKCGIITDRFAPGGLAEWLLEGMVAQRHITTKERYAQFRVGQSPLR
jgi:hypothetical protein